jgi:hypothetical protein
LQLRDVAIEAEFLKDIPEDQREDARTKLRESIERGTTDWARDYLGAAFPNIKVEEVLRRFGEQHLF